MALAAAPFAIQAETINLYGWQNHSWEFVDIDGGRSFDRIQSNAGNIGFSASMDTGMNGISVNLQCEQFTYYNHHAGGTGWCNRNSKIGLSHPQMGEIMFATWLLPYNEGVAQWVDPFYDAGADSHTSIMGSVGANTIFYNTGDFDFQASASGPTTGFSGSEFNYAGAGYDTGFNRRQENIIQYWSPNWNGFVFRFAWTAGNRDETTLCNGNLAKGADCNNEVDPVIRSSSLAYTNGPLWLAVTWQDHEDWSAVSVGEMENSDAESFRVAGRYIMDLGDGMSVQISAMWEDLEYEFNNVTNVDAAMSAFGYSKFASSGNLMVSNEAIRSQKTLGLLHELFGDADEDTTGEEDGISNSFVVNISNSGDNAGTHGTGTDHRTNLRNTAEKDDPLTVEDESMEGNSGINLETADDTTTDTTRDALRAVINKLGELADTDTAEGVQLPDDPDDYTTAQRQYATLVNAATTNARNAATMNSNVKIERDAWMVSGKFKFGGPVDFRFSYMDADDLEVSCSACSGDWEETAAEAWNVGMFYTMPGGTELRLTYSEVDNDDNGTYGQGISGTGLGTAGAEIEMFAVGIVHWFD